MPAVTIRNLPDDIHKALKARAALHGRSAESELRTIIIDAVNPSRGVPFGQKLVAIGRTAAATDEEIAIMESVRDRSPAQPMSFDE